jgi:hypothetical protein
MGEKLKIKTLLKRCSVLYLIKLALKLLYYQTDNISCDHIKCTLCKQKTQSYSLFMKDLSAVVALELVHVVGHLPGLLVPVPVVSLHFLLQTEKF